MENAAEALKMAAAVLIFVLALSICIASFSQARVASQTLLERTDKDYYTSFMTSDSTERIVGLETIIPTIYKAYYENYKVVFRDSKNSDDAQNHLPDGLYKQNDGNGNMQPVYEIDLEGQNMGTRIELFIAAILYGKSYFDSNKYDGKSYYSETEGEMTKVRASYVCENALYEYSMQLGLPQYIKVGHGEATSGGKFKKAIVADIFEALMGAIYLDLGYATARRVILDIIVPYIKNPSVSFFEDYKSALQEAVQTSQKSLYYELIEESGPPHDKQFTMQVKIDDIIYGVGKGSSKKEAEQVAAKNALEKLAS